MLRPIGLCGCVVIVLSASAVTPAGAPPQSAPAEQISWKKTVLDLRFRGEGIGIVDVNNDGKPDLVVGDYWYENPTWTWHAIRESVAPLGFDPAHYSEAFCIFPGDFNNDGWQDVVVIPFPGKECFWYENPKGGTGLWKQHPVWRSACNETPQYADLFGDGKKVVIMGIQPEGQMCWFQPSADVDKPWEPHPISEPHAPGTNPFSHGLGVGDVNGDGRLDVIIKEGWWEQPPDARVSDRPWKFHKANLGEDCSDMYAFDVDGDGLADVISASAHRRGVWWHKQMPGAVGANFVRHDILTFFTQTHAMHFVDINGDGRKDIVTGKRWWAHGRTGDVDSTSPAVLYWIEIVPEKDGPPKFLPHLIDDNSGVGTSFAVGDVNGDGLLDIAVANKKGVFLFEQMRRKP